jgi:hypothetical protein
MTGAHHQLDEESSRRALRMALWIGGECGLQISIADAVDRYQELVRVLLTALYRLQAIEAEESVRGSKGGYRRTFSHDLLPLNPAALHKFAEKLYRVNVDAPEGPAVTFTQLDESIATRYAPPSPAPASPVWHGAFPVVCVRSHPRDERTAHSARCACGLRPANVSGPTELFAGRSQAWLRPYERLASEPFHPGSDGTRAVQSGSRSGLRGWTRCRPPAMPRPGHDPRTSSPG